MAKSNCWESWFHTSNCGEQSDIFTYPTQAIVIATDVGMNRRNEYPPTMFHLLAGPNLRIWNRACDYNSRLSTVTGRITRSSLLERNSVTLDDQQLGHRVSLTISSSASLFSSLKEKP